MEQKNNNNIKPSRQKKCRVSNPQIISRFKPKKDKDEEEYAIRMAEGRARNQTGNFYYF